MKVMKLIATSLVLLLGSSNIHAQVLQTLSWEDLFRIYRANYNAKQSLISGMGYDKDTERVLNSVSPLIKCVTYKKTMVNNQGEWDESITVCDRSDQVFYRTENSTFYLHMKSQLDAIYGFPEPSYSRSGTEVYKKPNAKIECKSTPGKGHDALTLHTIKISYLPAKVDKVLPTEIMKIADAQYYALVVGVSQYDAPLLNGLIKPAEDAKALYEILINKYGFNKADSKILTGNVTKDEIIKGIESFKPLPENANLLIFFAGHGVIDRSENDNEGYWYPSDVEPGSVSNSISNNELKILLKDINAGHLLVIADACFSGNILTEQKVNELTTIQQTYEEYYAKRSRQLISSVGNKKTPDNSRFFTSLKRVLNANSSQFLSAEDVFTIIYNETKNDGGNYPLPIYGRLRELRDGAGNFIFVRDTN